jgi:preprotein translocase subunit SecG
MDIALIVLIIIVAILLVLVVLAQNSKGGTFASNFSASNQIIGVKKTGDLLEKLTWGFAIGLMVLCLAFNLLVETPDAEQGGTPSMRAKSPQGMQAPGQPTDTAAQQAPSQEVPAPAGTDSGAAADPLK